MNKFIFIFYFLKGGGGCYFLLTYLLTFLKCPKSRRFNENLYIFRVALYVHIYCSCSMKRKIIDVCLLGAARAPRPEHQIKIRKANLTTKSNYNLHVLE